jgi:hypothetical protein
MQQQILRLLELLPMLVIIKSLNMQMATGLIAVLIIYAIIADMAAKKICNYDKDQCGGVQLQHIRSVSTNGKS